MLVYELFQKGRSLFPPRIMIFVLSPSKIPSCMIQKAWHISYTGGEREYLWEGGVRDVICNVNSEVVVFK